MRTLLATDAKEGGASSAPQNDAIEAASSAAQPQGSETPTETLQDIVASQFAESQPAEEEKVASQDGTEPEEEKTSDGEEEPIADGKTEKVEEDKAAEAEAKVEAKEGDEELPPFHEHPRWKQMVEERNTLREKIKVAEVAEPLVKQQRSIVDYCQANGITPEQFQNGLEILALINTNPVEAAKKLQPIMEQIGQFDGSKLPQDLEEAVAEGKLELEFAQRLAKAEAQGKFGSQRAAKTQAQLEQERVQAAIAANGNALAAWEDTTGKGDPDFRPKKDGEADGIYEFVADRFRVLVETQQPKSPQEVVKLADQAYKSVKQTFTTRLTPKQPIRKPLESVSSAKAKREPKTMEEAVLQELGLD